MNNLKEKISKVLKETHKLDWFIIHRLSKHAFDEIKFSFVDYKEDYQKPFKKNLGYITFENEDYFPNYKQIIKDLIVEFKNDTIALANLYIITIRTSFRQENEKLLENLFKKEIGQEKIKEIFNLFVESLNSHYYLHIPSDHEQYNTLNKWLDLFRDVGYLHDISDILFSILYLIEEKKYYQNIDYQIIKDFKPLIKARILLFSKIRIDAEALLNLINDNIKEASFFAALLIEKDAFPDWMNKEILKVFLLKYWEKIGKNTFNHIYGISYRNKSKDYSKLRDLIHNILIKKLQKQDRFSKIWLSSLTFPDDFISLFSWIYEKKIDVNSIDKQNIKFINKSLIKEFKRISEKFDYYIASENDYFPFRPYQLNELEYKVSLSYILLFLISSNKDDFEEYKKDLRKILFKIKLQFYGTYKSTYLAKSFTEIIFLIVLSAINIKNGLTREMLSNLESLIDLLVETILMPYIHLIEREEEIWNKETEKERYRYNIGQYLINIYLKEIQKNKNNLKNNFKKLFELFDNVKIAEWPYER